MRTVSSDSVPSHAGSRRSPEQSSPSKNDDDIGSVADSEDTTGSPEKLAGKDAWANAQLCAICKVVFSKARLKPRHHCRICGRSVCASCSPSSVQLEGYKKMERACTPCVANAAKVPAVHSRLVRLGEQLDALGGKYTGPSFVAVQTANLEEALDFCESAVAPLEDLRDRLAAEKARAEKLEVALETEKRVRAQLEQELQGRKRTFAREPLRVSEGGQQNGNPFQDDSDGNLQPRGMNCVRRCTIM